MKKLTDEKKAILMYSGELLIFAIVFLVLSILKFTGIMGYNPTRGLIFNWITIVGAGWGIADFIWAICSKKRRQRICLLDKILVLPLTFFMVTYDLICFIAKPENESFYLTMIAIAFLYVAVIYTFEAVYHYFKPIPGLLEEIREEKEEKEKEEASKETEAK